MIMLTLIHGSTSIYVRGRTETDKMNETIRSDMNNISINDKI